MNPDVAAASDVPNIKIKIPGDDESHDQTPPPVAASHASSSDSVDEITNSVHDLYWHALEDQWDKMLPIVENDPNCVRIQLTGLGDTALHVAANAGSTRFVKELVKLMRPEDVLIPNKEGMLPVHLAALSFHHRIVQLLCSDHLLDKMAYEDIKKLFFMTISSNMFDVAIKLFEKHPVELTSARDEEQLTSLHLLARKPYKVLRESSESGSNEEEIETEEEKREDKEKKSSSHSDSIDKTETAFLVAARTMVNELLERISSVIHNLNAKNSKCYKGKQIHGDTKTEGTGIRLLYKIWDEVSKLIKTKKLKIDEILALTTEPSVVLFDAIESGNGDSVIWCFMDISALLMTLKDSNGRNLVHLFFLYRRVDFFEQFTNKRKQYLLRAVDNEDNNVLHLAALLPPEFKSFSGLSAKIQMKKELSWFQYVERKVPDELKSMRNKNGKTPIDVFYDEHNQLSKDIKESAKGIADSGMVVATLVATVAFAAALTVPGDKSNAWFIVFIVTNAIALFTSSASILSFLSNFTSSRFADTEFVISLHPSLTFGPELLIISVAFMVVAFIAASFLIFDCTTKWVSYGVTPMGIFPLLVFILFQSKFFDDSYWSKYYRPDPKLGRETKRQT